MYERQIFLAGFPVLISFECMTQAIVSCPDPSLSEMQAGK